VIRVTSFSTTSSTMRVASIMVILHVSKQNAEDMSANNNQSCINAQQPLKPDPQRGLDTLCLPWLYSFMGTQSRTCTMIEAGYMHASRGRWEQMVVCAAMGRQV
jgi:hypothetical protein